MTHLVESLILAVQPGSSVFDATSIEALVEGWSLLSQGFWSRRFTQASAEEDYVVDTPTPLLFSGRDGRSKSRVMVMVSRAAPRPTARILRDV